MLPEKSKPRLQSQLLSSEASARMVGTLTHNLVTEVPQLHVLCVFLICVRDLDKKGNPACNCGVLWASFKNVLLESIQEQNVEAIRERKPLCWGFSKFLRNFM